MRRPEFRARGGGRVYNGAIRDRQNGNPGYDVIEGETLTLDLYRPAFAEGSLPVVVVVHGGGWTSGDKRDLPDLNEYLASRGYVVASVQYRLAPQWPFPAQQRDVSAAINYVKNLADTHSLDPERLALIGRSSGGQIALLTSYTSDDPAIKGVVSVYGPAALRLGLRQPREDRRGRFESAPRGVPRGPTRDTRHPVRCGRTRGSSVRRRLPRCSFTACETSMSRPSTRSSSAPASSRREYRTTSSGCRGRPTGATMCSAVRAGRSAHTPSSGSWVRS